MDQHEDLPSKGFQVAGFLGPVGTACGFPAHSTLDCPLHGLPGLLSFMFLIIPPLLKGSGLCPTNPTPRSWGFVLTRRPLDPGPEPQGLFRKDSTAVGLGGVAAQPCSCSAGAVNA